ncbi:uncharacterized protein SPPG_00344 [Spizellomyces punctatus DAOM BR117]|uniref:Uncharacterized protein n=1 Tax=Spizellomyces punctatus (strain DAOM BR117) TaxID=645134 RepID=A0A0L0HU73_SPIPD|nr:uncharacterized protein SPPG_00344 [Spizellomyces punctatus DAOM BR117]KND04627.1 hypothetical protein SPPG_00344 [Spizellomyces punctatus DAOM BR117]|eukprot:XP_016612666.1 hypothetical protein SPPG_00344 [Spizellomyces punctatus DAOM BR117]
MSAPTSLHLYTHLQPPSRTEDQWTRTLFSRSTAYMAHQTPSSPSPPLPTPTPSTPPSPPAKWTALPTSLQRPLSREEFMKVLSEHVSRKRSLEDGEREEGLEKRLKVLSERVVTETTTLLTTHTQTLTTLLESHKTSLDTTREQTKTLTTLLQSEKTLHSSLVSQNDTLATLSNRLNTLQAKLSTLPNTPHDDHDDDDESTLPDRLQQTNERISQLMRIRDDVLRDRMQREAKCRQVLEACVGGWEWSEEGVNEVLECLEVD